MDERKKIEENIARVLREAGGVDVPHGEHYEWLLDLIADELSVQLMVSEIAATEDQVAHLAEMIALEVDYAFNLTPRDFRPFDEPVN